MKIKLKSLHKVSMRLSDGSRQSYFYAWRGGPRMESSPGTSEFVEEWKRLCAGRNDPDIRFKGSFQEIINRYQRTQTYLSLSESTKKDYSRRILKRIEPNFGKMPIAAVGDDRARTLFLDWRDAIAEESGTREADYSFSILARIVAWGVDRRLVSVNQCLNPGRLHRGSRVEFIWGDEEIEAFLETAPPHVSLPFAIAIETGQRQGDLLRMTWSQYDGRAIRLRQSKTGKNLVVTVTKGLANRLDSIKSEGMDAVTICLNSRGQPWTSDGFKSSFADAKAAAVSVGASSVGRLTFHDTRGTAVVNLALAGCSVPEIVSVTGHSLKDAESILDAHYLGRDRRLGESAISKLEDHAKRTQTVK